MQIFEQLVGRSEWIKRYSLGPFCEKRNAFLLHLQERGQSRRRMRDINRFLLGIAEHIDLNRDGLVGQAEIQEAAENWAKQHCGLETQPANRHVAKRQFIHIAMRWLRFLGKWHDTDTHPCFSEELNAFLHHLRSERGYTDQTISTRKRALDIFLTWLTMRGCTLAEVTPATIAIYFSQHKTRNWKRATIAVYVQSLRAFFRFAGQRGWCVQGLDGSIERPHIYSLAGLPEGPIWKDVQRLIAHLDTELPVHIRDRAIILLLAVYGLRIGEVCRLTVDDIDWQAERLHVRRLKRRKFQEHPLTAAVGNAILQYLREVRPQTSHREIFLTVKTPHRPTRMPGLSACIRLRLQALGLHLSHSGPHCLRHACASHLLSEGFSIKEIGDQLGHRSARSTQIYAKVGERGLREVSDIDLGHLIDYVRTNHVTVEPDWAADRLIGLREVANFPLGGVL